MKKILIVFFTCMAVLFTTFMITNKHIDFSLANDSLKSFFGFNKDNINYNNNFKINELQPKKADVYFNNLDENQKKIYSAIAFNVKELNTNIRFDNYNKNNIDKIALDAKIAMSAFFADHPEVFYLNSTYNLSLSKTILYDNILLKVTYSVKNKSELKQKIEEISYVLDEYTKGLNSNNIFENELYLHDKLAKEVKYYDGNLELDKIPEEYHNVYGTLIKKISVCDGFAKAMQLLLEKVGIESIFATGFVDKEPHAWNLVNLKDNWYHIDITSDKYIKEKNGDNIVIAHTYFNVTDEFLSKTHKFENINLLPKANQTEYNYYIKNNYVIRSTDNFSKKIQEIIESQKLNNALEFMSDGVLEVPNKLINALYNLNFNNYKDSGKTVKMKYYNDRDTFIIKK